MPKMRNPSEASEGMSAMYLSRWKRFRSIAPFSLITSTSAVTHGWPPVTRTSCHGRSSAGFGEVAGAITFLKSAPGATFDDASLAKVSILAAHLGTALEALRMKPTLPRGAPPRQYSG